MRAAPPSRPQLWAGRFLSMLAVLFMLLDSVIKLVVIQPVVEEFTRLGYQVSLARGIGILELGLLVIYLIPRTTILGGILLTGYLGGAVVTHLRIGDPIFSHILFPVYIGALLWGGVYLRDARLRAIISREPELAASRSA